jgi:hypothetical protein
MTKESMLQFGVFVACALVIYAIGSNEAIILAALAPPLQFLCVAALGFIFHWLRGKFRFAYGGIEVYVGLFAIGSFTLGVRNIASPHDEYLAELIGSVYLMVRGLENITNYRGSDSVLRYLAGRLSVRAYGTSSKT